MLRNAKFVLGAEKNRFISLNLGSNRVMLLILLVDKISKILSQIIPKRSITKLAYSLDLNEI